MKTIANILIFMVASIATAFGQEITTKEYQLTDYNSIEVTSSVDVKLVSNGKEGVSVRCDERLQPAIKIKQNGHKLQIGLNWEELKKITGKRRIRNVSINNNKVKINGMLFKGGIHITANIKNIRRIKTSSSGDVKWNGNLPTDELHLKASSSGDIKWKGILNIDKLYINCSSSGDVEGNYNGKNAFVQLSSSGDYEGEMKVETLKVKVSSSGDFIGQVKAKKATFNLSSAGDAKVKGMIDSLYVNVSSSADFHGKKIKYKYAEVKTSSNGDIYLSKSGKIVDKTPKRTGVFVD